jgi:hypothetical protein
MILNTKAFLTLMMFFAGPFVGHQTQAQVAAAPQTASPNTTSPDSAAAKSVQQVANENPTPPTTPQNSPEPSTTENSELSGSRLALSLFVGSTLGFGLGHTIQGRYNERGWLTIAELSALYVMGTGFLECDAGFSYLFGRQSSPTPVNQNGCGLIKAGSLVYVGLRIFEFVDLVRLIPTSKRLPQAWNLRIHPNSLQVSLNF